MNSLSFMMYKGTVKQKLKIWVRQSENTVKKIFY